MDQEPRNNTSSCKLKAPGSKGKREIESNTRAYENLYLGRPVMHAPTQVSRESVKYEREKRVVREQRPTPTALPHTDIRVGHYQTMNKGRTGQHAIMAIPVLTITNAGVATFKSAVHDDASRSFFPSFSPTPLNSPILLARC